MKRGGVGKKAHRTKKQAESYRIRSNETPARSFLNVLVDELRKGGFQGGFVNMDGKGSNCHCCGGIPADYQWDFCVNFNEKAWGLNPGMYIFKRNGPRWLAEPDFEQKFVDLVSGICRDKWKYSYESEKIEVQLENGVLIIKDKTKR